ncbi:Ig-like domain-containing protein [Thalassotalea sp. HSM 43]|uniref:Ig-like domain-containing protein n=1 Tax=Thalassotalea sp. HSM 43 TaxID=2552945 RepID=UPI001E4A34C3|nr:Ig-like domain-containing protein [Thalassotalea sp. HSM 43]
MSALKAEGIFALKISYLFLFTTIFLSCINTAYASEKKSNDRNVEALLSNLEQQSLKLSKLAKSNDKSKLHQQAVLDLAKQRHAGLLELIEYSPKEVLKLAIPNSSQNSKIAPYLLQKRKLSGQIEVIYQDSPRQGQTELQYTLISDNKRFLLKPTSGKPLQDIRSGAQVVVEGLELQSAQESYIVLEQSQLEQNTVSQASAVSSSATIGEQSTLVMLINFADNADVKPWTAEQAESLVFGDVNAFVEENSYGKTWLTGYVEDFQTLPIQQSCDSWDIYVASRDVMDAKGVDINAYDKIIYIFPENAACGWTGKATLGGDPGRTYINGSFTLNTIAHELGHNFGLQHANAFECGYQSIADNCLNISYGDKIDVMGAYGNEGHFNAFNKEILNWANDIAPSIDIISESGDYLISPLADSDVPGVKGVKLLRHQDANGNHYWYYLEYRTAHGFDDFLADTPALTQGVIVHYASDANIESSRYLDMTPESDFYDWDDAALPLGQQFHDADAGITIEPVQITEQGILVNVQLDQAQCLQVQPTISVQEPATWKTAGESVSYAITVANNNNTHCAATGFDLTATLPDGWSAEQLQVVLESGQSVVKNLVVSSSTSAADGFYNIDFTATNQSSPEYSSTASANFVIESPLPECVAVTPQLQLLSQSQSFVAAGEAITYQMLVTNLDNEACDSSSYLLDTVVPQQWLAESKILQLAPQQSQQVALTITSAEAALTDDYQLSVSAKNNANADLVSFVDVNFSVDRTLACQLSTPTLTLTSAALQQATSGQPLEYQLLVVNNNSSDCDDANFSISADVPTGWQSNTVTANLASGTQKAVSITVISAQNAESMDYSIMLSAVNNADANYNANANATYRVLETVNNAPNAVNDVVELSAKSPIDINVLSNDSDPENDNLVVSAVTQGNKGSVTVLSNGMIRYSPAKSFKSTDSFSYTISDGVNQSTATVNISLQSSGDDGGGSGGNGGNGGNGGGKKPKG